MAQDWSKLFQKFTWYNSPRQDSPLNDTNLNKINNALDGVDTRVVQLDTIKADVSAINNMLADVSLDETTGVLTVTKKDGTIVTYDTALEKIAINFEFDKTTNEMVITLEDGTVERMDLSSLITSYDFSDGDVIGLVEENGVVSAQLKAGSITDDYLDSDIVTRASESATLAESYAEQSESNAQTSDYNAKISQSYAIGGTDYREDEDTDNAKYYYEQTKEMAGKGMPDPSAKDKLLISDEDLKWVEIDKSEIGGGGSGMPTPSAENKLLISNSSLEWEEIDKSDISEHYELPVASADTLGGIKIGSGLNISEDGTVSVNPNTVHIQYVTSGSLDANTTTVIHVEFEREYINIPKVAATISPLQTNFPSNYVYINSVTNITNTGCDVNVMRVGNALNLSASRKIAIVIESQDTVGNGGAITDVIVDGNERCIGTYYGEKLYEKNIHLNSCTLGNHAHNISNIGKIINYDSFFRNNESTFNLPYVNSYQITQSVEIVVNKSNIVLAGGLDLGGYEADITIRYTKLA